MANEAERTYATTVNHVVDGPSLTAGTFSADTDVDTAMSGTNGNDYPYAQLILTCAFSVAPTALRAVNVYAQRLNIVSTNDAPIPDSSYPHEYVGSLFVDGVTATQYLLTEVELPQECNFILENDTDQTLSVNWDLDVRPFTVVPGA